MKKYLLLFLTLFCSISAMDNELLHNKPTQPIVQKNDECIVCLEEAQEIEKQHGAKHLRVTDCCNQFLCGECLKKTVAQQIQIHGYLQCPYCRRKSLTVLLAKKAEPKQKLKQPLSNGTINQPQKEKLHNHPQPNVKLSNQQYEPIDRYVLFKQNPPAYLTSSISAEDKLYRAILNDSAEEVRFAVEQGANINRKYCKHFENKPPLAVAVSLTKSNAVEALLECGASGTGYQSFPTIIDKGSPVRPYHGTWTCRYPSRKLLQISLLLGDIKSALALVKAGAKWSDFQGNNHCDIINQILRFYPQEKQASLELMQIIINQGYNIKNSIWRKNIWRNAIHDDHGYSVLDNQLIQFLMQNNVDINQYISGSDGRFTPLAIAIRNGKLQIIKYLLDNGADISKQISVNLGRREIQKLTPLSYALYRRSKNQPNMNEVVEYLQNCKQNNPLLNNKPQPNKKLNSNQQNKLSHLHNKLKQQLTNSIQPDIEIISSRSTMQSKHPLYHVYIHFNKSITRRVSDLVMKAIKKRQLHTFLKRNLSNLQNHVIEVETFMTQAELQKIIDQVNNSL